MARNEHKKVLQQLSEAYQEVHNENLLKMAMAKKGWEGAGKQLSKAAGSGKPAKGPGGLIKGRKKPGMLARMGGQESEKIDHELAGLIDLYATAVSERIIDISNPTKLYSLGGGDGPPCASARAVSSIASDSKYQPLLDIYCSEDGGRLLNDIYRRYKNDQSGSVVYYTEGYDGPWKNPDRERPDSGDAAMEFDRRGFAKNTKAGKEDEEDDLQIGADVMWDGQRKRGIVDEVDIERGIAIVIDHDGEEHIVELGEFDVVVDPNTETPEEFKHLY